MQHLKDLVQYVEHLDSGLGLRNAIQVTRPIAIRVVGTWSLRLDLCSFGMRVFG